MIHLLMPTFRNLSAILIAALLGMSCSPSRQIRRTDARELLDAPVLRTAHTGISIYDPGKGTYLFNLQGDKYFVPASNTKLATCYAAMKYLGDSLVGGYAIENPDTVYFQPAGDPTFLLSEFKNQPLIDFFRQNRNIIFNSDNWREERWGNGWSWNDYEEYYMAERSVMPMYGNVMTIIPRVDTPVNFQLVNVEHSISTMPPYFSKLLQVHPEDLEINRALTLSRPENLPFPKFYLSYSRDIASNRIQVHPSFSPPGRQLVSFYTGNFSVLKFILSDTIFHSPLGFEDFEYELLRSINNDTTGFDRDRASVIKTQPTDSLLRPMMHRSDNFFAEQSLLMVSNRVLGFMKDAAIIDTIMKTDFSDLPQKPRWVDGSGLSRYNLFTPQDMVMILDKMRRDFGMDRLKNILATGNTGTLRNYFVSDSSFIYAKTGTLSGVVALSGFLYTQKGRLLEFSVLVNNHTGSATDVRRSVEKFLKAIRRKY